MTRTNIFLTAPLLKRLAVLVKATGLSRAEIIRRALEQYLDLKHRPAKGRA